MTHDYKRNVGTGEVLTDCRKHHKGADVLRFFKLIDDRRLRRRTFNSVAVLVDAIETWVEHWNDNPKSFVWHKTAEEIGAKVRRGRAALAEVKCATQD